MGVILGAWDGDSLCGVLGLALAPSLSDGTLYAQECFWFMDPPRRGAGGKLLKAGEEWAWRYGAEYLMMVGLSTSKATVGTFLRRRGYQAMETRYVLRRPPVEEVEGEEMPS
jgi:GNAT superfamily N-acetyltransferase